MSRYLVTWPAGRWSSMLVSTEAEAKEMERRGATVQEVAVTGAGAIGVCCTIIPKKETPEPSASQDSVIAEPKEEGS